MDAKRLRNYRRILCSSILLPVQTAHQMLNLLELVLLEERVRHLNLKTHGLRHQQCSQQPACDENGTKTVVPTTAVSSKDSGMA